MAATILSGVGEEIDVPPTTPQGQSLYHANVPAGQTWVIESIIEQIHTPPANMGQFVLHIFVTAGGQTFSPWWIYAKNQEVGDWWRPEFHALHIPVVGPAAIDVVAVNISPAPQKLLWCIPFTVTGSVG